MTATEQVKRLVRAIHLSQVDSLARLLNAPSSTTHSYFFFWCSNIGLEEPGLYSTYVYGRGRKSRQQPQQQPQQRRRDVVGDEEDAGGGHEGN